MKSVKKHRSRQLSREVQTFLRTAKAVNTVRAYASDVRHFIAWGGRIPAAPARVAEYLAHLCAAFRFASIARRKAAIAAAHRDRGYPSPCEAEIVRATMKGVRRKCNRLPRQMRPLLGSQLAQIANAAAPDLHSVRDKALLVLGFAGAFRRSELVALEVGDCGWRGKDLVIRLRRSKTDQAGRGRDVVIPDAMTGLVGTALMLWVKTANIRGGALFRRIARDGGVLEDRLPAAAVTSAVKKAARAIGLDSSVFGAHSLRAGYVTTAAMAGVPLWEIKKQTGHSRETMVETYVRTEGAASRVVLL